MPIIPIIRRTETFDWISEDAQTRVRFPITAMLAAMVDKTLNYETLTTRISATFVLAWLVSRVDTTNFRPISEPRLGEPVLGAWMPDRSILLIDGSHRYYARYQRGLETIDYNVLLEEDWQRFATIRGKWPPV